MNFIGHPKARWLVGILGLFALLIAAGNEVFAQSQPQPKQVFDINVSLEWQPGEKDDLPDTLAASGCSTSGAAPTYIDDLNVGLRNTASYLYTYSRGEMAIGKVTIFTNGENWDRSHIRIMADNSYRPSAYIGGIVKTPTKYTAPGNKPTQIFYPGAVYLGRAWNGAGGRCGLWSLPNGWRTMGHEWAHYAMYLYDEYYNIDTMAAQYCTTTKSDLTHMLPTDPNIAVTDSLMAYHYRADQMWNGAATPSVCLNTPQRRVHGTSDWHTIKRFYSQVTVPTTMDVGPRWGGSPAEPLFSVAMGSVITPSSSSVAKLFMTDGIGDAIPADSFILREDADGRPIRVIGQGQLLKGENGTAYGVQEAFEDRLVSAAQDPVENKRSEYPGDYAAARALTTEDLNDITLTGARWRPGMRLTPILSMAGAGYADVTGLRVELTDCTATAKRVQVSYCPAGGSCTTPVNVSLNRNGIFEHRFVFPADANSNTPALKGYIYARDPTNRLEVIVPYQLTGGVGPATITGHAPLSEPSFEVEPPSGAAPLMNLDTQLMIAGSTSCSLNDFSLPGNVLGIVGTPLYVQPVKANRQGVGWLSSDGNLRVRMSYNQDLLNRAGILESKLVLLRLVGGDWVQIPALGRSYDLDWIAGQAQKFEGDGAWFALGYR